MNDRNKELKAILDEKVEIYNQRSFIPDDPISVPHRFSKKQDIEIAGFLSAIFAWGQRVTIIKKSLVFLEMMDNSPHDFLLNHKEEDLKPFLKFKHRTFNTTDALYFLSFLSWFYKNHDSLELAFLKGGDMETRLKNFFTLFFSLPNHPKRTYKHIPNPARKSACKRINMYLRWMVRQDDKGVDFGLWNTIKPSELICPCDLHVDRVARSLGLIERKQTNWQAAVELTATLKRFEPKDPVKYDFALFGMGVMDKLVYK